MPPFRAAGSFDAALSHPSSTSRPLLTKADLRAAPRALRTARLRLESPRIVHAAAFVESLNTSLPALGFIAWAHRSQSLAWAERFCEDGARLVDDGECLIFNAFEAESGDYVGRIDLHSFDLDVPRGEVGYVGDTRRAGRGLMREAVLEVVELGFRLGLVRIQAVSDVRNARALRFAENALGFVREGVLRHYERDEHGQVCDQVMFAACRIPGR